MPALLIQGARINMTTRSIQRPEKAFFPLRRAILLESGRLAQIALFKITNTFEFRNLWWTSD